MKLRTLAVLAAIEIVLGGVVGYTVIDRPHRARQQALAARQREAQAIQQTQADIATLLAQLEQHERRLSPEREPSWLARQMVGLTDEAGIRLSAITQDQAAPFESLRRLGVRLQFSASYHQLGALLDRLERSGHLLRVEQLDVRHSAQSGESLDVQLAVSTLHAPPLLGGR
jgi:Tfp pilus assembly protein PilO